MVSEGGGWTLVAKAKSDIIGFENHLSDSSQNIGTLTTIVFNGAGTLSKDLRLAVGAVVGDRKFTSLC